MSDAIRDAERELVKSAATRVWPRQTFDIVPIGGWGRPAETIEVWRITTMSGRTLVFRIQMPNAAEVANFALNQIADRGAP